MTVTAATDLDPTGTLHAQVVVVGGGPAGLSIAVDLAARSVDVLVLESGGREVTEAGRDLDVGEVTGEPLRFAGTTFGTADLRLRALGGASGHWAGMCRPLDEIDLRARSWIPRSGWPIERAELDPWYRTAEATLRLGTTGWDPAAWYERCGTKALFGSERLQTTIFQFSPPVRFAETFAPQLEADDGPRVVLGATVVDAELAAGDDRITSLLVRRSDGRTIPVTADLAFVVATGGLEVPRLLLAWGDGRGIANSSGLVGRGYLDHPHRDVGQVRIDLGSDLPPLYAWGDTPGEDLPAKVWAGWSLTPELQEAERLGNGVALLRFTDGPESAQARPTEVTQAMGPLVEWTGRARPVRATLSVRTEQRPNLASRVTLARARDATGLPRLRLDWRPTEQDVHSGRRLVELLAAEVGRAGIGRVEVDPRGTPFGDTDLEIGCHPMGSARMSEDPGAGVVDADLRSHDLANLYVCSSAVFPTSGHANPTLTIVALAHRLADHLAGQAQGRP